MTVNDMRVGVERGACFGMGNERRYSYQSCQVIVPLFFPLFLNALKIGRSDVIGWC